MTMSGTTATVVKIIIILAITASIAYQVFSDSKKRKENKNLAIQKPFAGILLLISMITTPCLYISLYFSGVSVAIILAASLVIFNVQKIRNFFEKKRGFGNTIMFILPLILYLASYTIPVCMVYEKFATPILLSFYKIICSLFIVCILAFMLLHLKYAFMLISNRINIKRNKDKKIKKLKFNELYETRPITIYPMVLIMYIPIVMM